MMNVPTHVFVGGRNCLYTVSVVRVDAESCPLLFPICFMNEKKKTDVVSSSDRGAFSRGGGWREGGKK